MAYNLSAPQVWAWPPLSSRDTSQRLTCTDNQRFFDHNSNERAKDRGLGAPMAGTHSRMRII
ncbi:uncharacterized protein Dana_GF26728, isoform A [Drosophila ananassae]|uniref:Uncharacterized protein, isoform A n=1 Tax=Drosophila ananassae TaxID=7217 RepID=A0A0N8NZ02_DROAN|nr:uncharacterized protein Dana_GF26728, isoform A [Drosophila ananassae]